MLYKEFECFGCTFGLHRVANGYVIYGEIEIVMLDLNFDKIQANRSMVEKWNNQDELKTKKSMMLSLRKRGRDVSSKLPCPAD